MIEIGLMPSDTGKPNGKQTGQGILHYPIIGGVFILSCNSLLVNQEILQHLCLDSNSALPSRVNYQDEFAALNGIEQAYARLLLNVIAHDVDAYSVTSKVIEAKKKVKVKYTCLSCEINVWGKPGLLLKCNSCNLDLTEK
jgi:hypothetical protein